MTRILFFAVATLFMGCDDTTDCPATVAASSSCTSAGLTCFVGAEQCTCTGGLWQCKTPDMAATVPHDLASPERD